MSAQAVLISGLGSLKFERTGESPDGIRVIDVRKLEVFQSLESRKCECGSEKFVLVRINGQIFKAMCDGCKKFCEVQ